MESRESYEREREPHLLFLLSARMTDPQYNRSESEILAIEKTSQPVAGDVSRPQVSIAKDASTHGLSDMNPGGLWYFSGLCEVTTHTISAQVYLCC